MFIYLSREDFRVPILISLLEKQCNIINSIKELIIEVYTIDIYNQIQVYNYKSKS
jgi:hypothetical protein